MFYQANFPERDSMIAQTNCTSKRFQIRVKSRFVHELFLGFGGLNFNVNKKAGRLLVGKKS